MEYKVGQKVRIKSKDWVSEHGVFEFPECCGKVGTITGIENGWYHLDILPEKVFIDGECIEYTVINEVSQSKDYQNKVYKVTEKDLKGDINDFPIEIVQRMVDCQVKQGNYPDVIVFQNRNKTDLEHRGFAWSKTEEGLGFWDAVICEKNFNLFFQKYPKSNQVTIQKDMETNKLIINGITLPKDTEVKVSVEDGATIITFQKQEEVENPQFKKGDIVLLELQAPGAELYKHVSIIKGVESGIYKGDLAIYASFCYTTNNCILAEAKDMTISKYNIKSIRYATEEEIEKFNKEFANQKHLHWNANEFNFDKYVWRAEKGGKFWFITSNGVVDYAVDNYKPTDNLYFNLRNYFETPEIANKALPLWKDFFKNLSL